MKYVIAIFGMLALIGCSQFTINASMCNEIASDPHATMPEECRAYVDEEAQKAFDNTIHNKGNSDEEIIKFQKSQDD